MKPQYVLPITIVVAGALIAGAVFLAGKMTVSTGTGGTTGQVSARPYDPATDHILGNPQAPVKVIEYMDLECPHCKTFDETMHKVIEHYGASGQVAWVQRPFPLASIHSKAPQEAAAAECAAELGGNTGYWKYTEQLFKVTPSDNGLDLNQLPVIAQTIGLDVNAFNACLSSNKYAKKIADSYSEAIKLGAQGTPYTLIMVGGEAVVLAGNQPYDSMISAIDAVLQGVSSTTTQ